jgi:hypothetical protein
MELMLRHSNVFHMARILPVCVFSAGVLLVSPIFAQSKQVPGIEGSQGPPAPIAKIQTNDYYAVMLINNIVNFYANNGVGTLNPISLAGDGESFEFPKGSGHTVIYDEQLIWGGFVNNKFNVGGTGYDRHLQAGKIITPGGPSTPPVADNPSLERNRVYRTRPDINPKVTFESIQAKLDSDEVFNMNRLSQWKTTARQVYDQYISDWNDWPASDGAPFKDMNGNGAYDPETDIPGVAGADQTLWYVANDLDSNRMVYTFDSPRTLGVELQKTMWAYKLPGALGNTIFTSSKLINKSSYALDSTFITLRTDNEIGGLTGYTTDFVGCDTVRNLGYAYKKVDNDPEYGSRPPAVGSLLLQGPLVPGSPTDTARLSGRRRAGYKNLKMTSFVPFLKRSPFDGPSNAKQYYYMMNGLLTNSGGPIFDSVARRITKFAFTGDPVAGQGWLDGIWSLGDRALQLSSGPFRFAPGDTQEVVCATIVAQGADRLASVLALRAAVDEVRSKYTSTNPIVAVETRTSLPQSFSLDQNYPNPFNPSTTIRFEIVQRSAVKLKIFNVLGQLLTTLVDEQRNGGAYSVEWNATEVASGVYFYQLQAGEFVQTKKMIFLR